ncbi:Trafficking protein particle complex subunit 10 [Halotydeus destructor]|nr:Trafficking protein particle complex subunit 10 [Halotydeus destructor]
MAAEPSLKVLGPPTMDRVPFEILSGIPQNIVLELNSGTSRIEQGTRLKIRVSRDLVMKLQADLDGEVKSEIELALTVPLKPFDSFPIALLIKGKLANQRDTSVSEYTLTLSYETRGEVNVTKSTSTSIQLIAPLVSSLRLHTAHTRKFAEIILNGGSHQGFRITNPRMFRNDVNDELQIVGEAKQLVVTKEQSVHLVWEVDDSTIASRLILRLDYSLIDERNTLPGQSLPETYECEFRLKSYSTMFTVRAAIEPQKGFEFCRVGTLCSLKVTIDRICPADEACAIMYEVIGDSSTWNCTGRSAGVIDATIADLVNSSLTFDILPLASGYLPLPTVRLSKYVPSTMDTVAKAADTSRRSSLSNNSATSDQQASVGHSEARLVAFEVGQVYNASRALQVHVLPSSGLIHVDV